MEKQFGLLIAATPICSPMNLGEKNQITLRDGQPICFKPDLGGFLNEKGIYAFQNPEIESRFYPD